MIPYTSLQLKKSRAISFWVATVLVLTSLAFTCPKKRNVQLHFLPYFGDQKLELFTTPYTTPANDTLYIHTFRFYLSHITLVFENGKTYTDPIAHHLADAENSASMTINLTNVPEGKIKSIQYLVGVDSLANVSGALEGDLDPAKGMYWAWNSGYIHAKLEGTSTASTAHKKQFEFHIGGYLSPFSAARKISLPIHTPAENNVMNIKTDAATWLKNIDLHQTNSVVIPSEKAMQVANNYSTMFSIAE